MLAIPFADTFTAVVSFFSFIKHIKLKTKNLALLVYASGIQR